MYIYEGDLLHQIKNKICMITIEITDCSGRKTCSKLCCWFNGQWWWFEMNGWHRHCKEQYYLSISNSNNSYYNHHCCTDITTSTINIIISVAVVVIIKQLSWNVPTGLFWFRIKCEIMNPCRHLIELLGQEICPSQSFYLQRTKQHRKMQTIRKCHDWNLNLQSQYSKSPRSYVSSIAWEHNHNNSDDNYINVNNNTYTTHWFCSEEVVTLKMG